MDRRWIGDGSAMDRRWIGAILMKNTSLPICPVADAMQFRLFLCYIKTKQDSKLGWCCLDKTCLGHKRQRVTALPTNSLALGFILPKILLQRT